MEKKSFIKYFSAGYTLDVWLVYLKETYMKQIASLDLKYIIPNTRN